MPEINENFNNSYPTGGPEFKEPKRSKLPSKGRLFIVFSLIALIVIGTFLFQYFNPEAVKERKAIKSYEELFENQESWEKQFAEDTYGGSTPQETIDMFVDALKKGDLELASKYFYLEIDEESPEQMTYRVHLEYLENIKANGYLERFINDFQNFDDDFRHDEDVHWFVWMNEDGTIELEISVSLSGSGVWKIEKI